MLHGLVAVRWPIAISLAAIVGAWRLKAHPVDMTDRISGAHRARTCVSAALVLGRRAVVHHAVLRGVSLCFSPLAIAASGEHCQPQAEVRDPIAPDLRRLRDARRWYRHFRSCRRSMCNQQFTDQLNTWLT